jgi:hypothetical protein
MIATSACMMRLAVGIGKVLRRTRRALNGRLLCATDIPPARNKLFLLCSLFCAYSPSPVSALMNELFL